VSFSLSRNPWGSDAVIVVEQLVTRDPRDSQKQGAHSVLKTPLAILIRWTVALHAFWGEKEYMCCLTRAVLIECRFMTMRRGLELGV
jgi:hypothetical protein